MDGYIYRSSVVVVVRRPSSSSVVRRRPSSSVVVAYCGRRGAAKYLSSFRARLFRGHFFDADARSIGRPVDRSDVRAMCCACVRVYIGATARRVGAHMGVPGRAVHTWDACMGGGDGRVWGL